MAIMIEQRAPTNAIEFVGRADSAIDHEKSDYPAFLETGDQSKLVFKPEAEPTRFILNFDFKGKDSERIKNAMLGAKDDEGRPNLAFGSWSFTVAKLSLKEIRNPSTVPLEKALVFKKDDRGYVHDDLLAVLDRYGVVQDIFGLYTNLVMTPARAEAKN